MNIHDPIVVDFSMQTTDAGHPVNVNFDVQSSNPISSFTLSNHIQPVIRTDTFVFSQNQASNRWEIHHELKKYPSVTIVDSAGTVVIGNVQYVDENNVVCTFSAPFSGIAYLN